ncbi:MAG: TetR/AcrR family transcriptional regulator [Clostridia bacterium]|nr:TetR/AcrR family transcriptional regulator [Oscillospiraceae bacterium]MBQ9732751.1 TetR/AcrR family transcriptional regulator [Clostridia bacterium]
MSATKSSRRQQADATKRRIFDCALSLLMERGYENITIRDIVKAAEVSIGSFYHYYSSKLEVFLETYSIADDYFETVVAAELEGLSFDEKFALYFRHYALYASDVTGLALTKLLYSSDNKRFERGDSAGMHRVLIAILDQGLEEGLLVSDRSAAELSRFFLIAVRGLVYNWCTCDGGYDLAEAAGGYVRTLRRAFER